MPHTLKTPYHFRVAQTPIEGRCPVHKGAVLDAAPPASLQNCATPLGATRPSPPPPPPRETPCRVFAAQSPLGGVFPCTKRPLPTLGSAHRRPSLQNCATPLGATRPSQPPPPPRETPCRVFAAQSPLGGVFPCTKRPLPTLGSAHRRPSLQNCATPLGATRPSPPPPPPRETPCRVSAAQSPLGGVFPCTKRPLPTLGRAHRRPSAQNCATPLVATRPSPPPPTPRETPCHVSVAQSPFGGGGGGVARPQGGRSRLPTPSPRLNRRAHRASATCARLYLPEELAELQIAASLPAFFLLPPSRLDAAVRSSCRFGGEGWPWLQRA